MSWCVGVGVEFHRGDAMDAGFPRVISLDIFTPFPRHAYTFIPLYPYTLISLSPLPPMSLSFHNFI
jgi:hypothetical protein